MDLELHDATLVEPSNGARYWQVAYTVNGAAHYNVFSPSVLEWRVAEHDLDPDDVDRVLETVLYEPHLAQDPTDPRSLTERVTAVKGAGGIIEHPRREHSPRMVDLTKVKGTIVADSGRDKTGPLALLRQHTAINHERIAAMRERLDTRLTPT